jgi:hypothetical protein
MSVTIDLRADQSLETLLATLPPIPSLTDSVTHVACSPRVFGVHTDRTSLITIRGDPSSPTQMVDSGSNVCVTRNLGMTCTLFQLAMLVRAWEGRPPQFVLSSAQLIRMSMPRMPRRGTLPALPAANNLLLWAHHQICT